MKISQFKKFVLVLGPSLVLSASLISPVYADADSTAANGYLQRIATACETINTNVQSILNDVSNLPTYINTMVTFYANMTQYDDSTDTANMQEQFANTGKYIATDTNTQYSTFLGTATGNQPAVSLDAQMLRGATEGDVHKASTLLYSTLLGQPVQLPPKPTKDGSPGSAETPAANPGLSFMLNASGYSIKHTFPGGIIGPAHDDIDKYVSYYNTMVPIQSYNTFILSKMYAESKNNHALTKAQMQLAATASDSGWLAKVASSEIGIVLRQSLMFQSQNYVLMTQMLEAQKELVTLQAMNNSLLMVSNMQNEKQLLTNALSPQ